MPLLSLWKIAFFKAETLFQNVERYRNKSVWGGNAETMNFCPLSAHRLFPALKISNRQSKTSKTEITSGLIGSAIFYEAHVAQSFQVSFNGCLTFTGNRNNVYSTYTRMLTDNLKYILLIGQRVMVSRSSLTRFDRDPTAGTGWTPTSSTPCEDATGISPYRTLIVSP